MERRSRLFCFSCYFIITVVGFLVALLVAYKTLTGECEHPEDICYNDGKCYFDYRGFICECSMKYYGDRCQYVRYLSVPPTQKEVVLNGTNVAVKSNYTIGDQQVTHRTPTSNKTTETGNPDSQGEGEVKRTQIVRDKTLSPPYWRFIIIFGVVNSVFFILAYAVYVALDKANCIQNKTKESFGIKYEQAPQAQHLLLISNTSSLDA